MKIYISESHWNNEEWLNDLKKRADINISNNRPSQSEFEKEAKKYDGLIIGSYLKVNKELLDNSNIKFIGLLAKGSDNIDKKECAKRNISVFYTPEANISSVSEHIMCLILALSKNLINLDSSVRKGGYYDVRLSTYDLKGKTLGIIGAGAIARELIKRAKAFELNIICHTLNPETHQGLEVGFVSLEKLLAESDFVSACIPLNSDTKHYINYERLLLMKKTAYLINTSRGKVVDEKDLIRALREGVIAGAGLDVFYDEPVNNEDLFKLKNVILTPHIAGVSKEAIDRMESHVIADMIRCIEGQDPIYPLL